MKRIVSTKSYFKAFLLILTFAFHACQEEDPLQPVPALSNPQGTSSSGGSTGNTTRISDFPGKGRSSASSFVLDGKGYVGFGRTGLSEFFKDFYAYDPQTDQWTAVADSFPGMPRDAAAAFSVGDYGYVGLGYGRRSPMGSYDYLTDLWRFSTNSRDSTWKRMADCPFQSVGKPAVFEYDSMIVLVARSGVAKYDPYANVWTVLSNFPGETDRFSMNFKIGGKGYIFGGYDESSIAFNAYVGDVWEYNRNNDTWLELDTFPGIPRGNGYCAAFGKNAVIIGGNDFFANTNEVWRYDSFSDQWTIIDPFDVDIDNQTGFVIRNVAYLGTGSQPEPNTIFGFGDSKKFYRFTL